MQWLVRQIGIIDRLYSKAGKPNLALTWSDSLNKDGVIIVVNLQHHTFPAQMLVCPGAPLESPATTPLLASARFDAIKPLLHKIAVWKYADLVVELRCPAAKLFLKTVARLVCERKSFHHIEAGAVK